MKKLVLTLLCVGFANFAMANESPNLQIPADANTTLTTQFENIKTLEFPKDEKEEKELDELFKAIETLDSDKIKALIKQNPNLVNLQIDTELLNYHFPLSFATIVYMASLNDKSRNIALKNIKILLENNSDPNIHFNLSRITNKTTKAHSALLANFFFYLYCYNKNFDKNIELFDFLVEHGKLDLNLPCSINNDNFPIYAPCQIFIVGGINDDYRYKMFKFLIEKKVKINKTLSCLVSALKRHGDENVKDLFLLSQDFEYKYHREVMKKYFYDIFKHYAINEIPHLDLEVTGNYFIKTHDEELLKLMIDSGCFKIPGLYEYLLKIANEVKDENIINMIKGAKNGR